LKERLRLTPFPPKIALLQSPTESEKAAENLERESAAFVIRAIKIPLAHLPQTLQAGIKLHTGQL